MSASSDPDRLMDESNEEVAQIFRRQYGKVLAVLIHQLSDFDRAEESLAHAFARALEIWPERGVPASPTAWLVTTARHHAIDRIRREANFERKSRELRRLLPDRQEPDGYEEDRQIPDERLRLMFTACHPVLPADARVLAIATASAGAMVEARFVDCGPGVEPAMRAHLFQPFQTTKSEGMGMGLSISKSLVSAHGGELDYTDAPGGGACFTMRLPAAQPA